MRQVHYLWFTNIGRRRASKVLGGGITYRPNGEEGLVRMDPRVCIPMIVLLIAACSGRGVSPDGSMEFSSVSLGSLPGGWQGSSDTLSWTDSTRRGDTTFFSRGRVVTTTSVVSDSQWIQVPAPRVSTGIPMGLFGTWQGTQLKPNSEIFTLTYGIQNPGNLRARIGIARERGLKMVISMAGGARRPYLTDGVFDMEKWKARMDQFNTPELKDVVAEAVSEGILIGNSVMDEPFNEGGPGNEANSWGPRGTMSKARVDSMCGYAKTIFPTLPQGVFHDYRLEPEGSYEVCDFITSQYRTAKGPLTEYRDGALRLCRRDRIACSFAINVLDGGKPVRKTPGQTDYAPDDCPLTTTGGRGTYFPNCRMTPDQVREAGRVLGSAGCFLTGFRYDVRFLEDTANQRAFRDVIETLRAKQTMGCIRG